MQHSTLTGKAADIEEYIMPDPFTGESEWFSLEEAEKVLGFKLAGNGSPQLQNDRGLGLKYTVEKNKERNKITHFRTVGFATAHQVYRASAIPVEVRRYFEGHRCAHCNSSKKQEIDHKDGNKEPIQTPNKQDFQALCSICNKRKREACKKCTTTGVRFDARKYSYKVSHIVGTSTFQPKHPRCKGCYWYDCNAFKKSLVKGKYYED